MTTPPDTGSDQNALPKLATPAEVRSALSDVMKNLAKVYLVGPLNDEQRQALATAATQLEQVATQLLPTARVSAAPVLRPLEIVPDERSSVPTILVVDDDTEGRELVREILERHYKVLTAADATEGAKLLRESHPDVVMTDLYMPGGGGMTLLETVRSDEESSHTPVLVLSGAADLSAKIRAFESGAFDFMTKPVVADEILARVRNAVRRAQALRRERQLKGTDDLTGLANRRALRTYLTAAMKDAIFQGRPLTVAMIDQDGLKQINDVYGHHAGDEAIKAIARALSACKRQSDCAARLGGDEFALVMPGTDREGAIAFIHRVEEELAGHPIAVGDVLIPLRASFGLATVGEVTWDESWEDLMKRADTALYDCKRLRKQQMKLVS
ncbi:MAG: diguanylate cyclase [Myxococcaceae bacterium]